MGKKQIEKPRGRCALVAIAVAVLLGTTTQATWAAESASVAAARQAAAQGAWEEAASAAAAGVAADSRDVEAWYWLAEAKLALGDSAEAAEAYGQALKLSPRHPGAVLGATRYYLSVGQIEAAEQIVGSAEAADRRGRVEEVKVARAQVLAKRGQLTEATIIIASAAAKNPGNPLYPRLLGRLYVDQHVPELAEQHFAAAWELSPGDPSLAFEYGRVLLDRQKYNEALRLFKVVQERDPSNREVDLLVGRLYLVAGKFCEAAEHLERAVAKQPESFSAQLWLGQSHVGLWRSGQERDYARAAEAPLRAALALRPGRQDVATALAEVLVQRGRGLLGSLRGRARVLANLSGTPVDTAALCREVNALALEALALDSSAVGAHEQLARTYDLGGQLDSAAYHAEVEYRRDPASSSSLSRFVNLCQRLGQHRQLVELLAPLVADSANLARYGAVVASSQLQLGQEVEAEALLVRLLQLRVDDCVAYEHLAYLYIKNQRYSRAIPVLREAVARCPEVSSFWELLGDSYYFSNPEGEANLKQALGAYSEAELAGNTAASEKVEQLRKILEQRERKR